VLRRLRRDVRELAPGEELTLGHARVRGVPAVHAGRRWPLRAPAATLGYLVEGAGLRTGAGTSRVYFAGDTELFPGMADMADGLDAALLPIWGWGPTLGPGHMDPGQAARALALLRPALAVPIHWGTLRPLGVARREASVLREPARAFAALAAAAAPDVRIAVLDPGGSIALG
jgi:L-ascorbate metabolism protein UlaG (beta-lactamase superfamily)